MRGIPLPAGNLPDRPPDDPLGLYLVTLFSPRCLLPRPWRRVAFEHGCPLGRDGACGWGLPDRAAAYCAVYFTELRGDAEPHEVAAALGISRERVRQLSRRGLEALREAYHE